MLIGGYYLSGEWGRSTSLYELSGDSEKNLIWSKLDQKLYAGRSAHVSFPISNNLINYELKQELTPIFLS